MSDDALAAKLAALSAAYPTRAPVVAEGNPYDLACLRMMAGSAAAIYQYLAADASEAVLADVADLLARQLQTRVDALEARRRER